MFSVFISIFWYNYNINTKKEGADDYALWR